MGHIGLTPQSVHQLGGHKVQGKTPEAAERLLADARALEQAGAFAIVLELVPAPLSKLITQKVGVPTIGIGAGPDTDGQVLVLHDMLGLFDRFVPKFVKRYAELRKDVVAAMTQYAEDVREGRFPAQEHVY